MLAKQSGSIIFTSSAPIGSDTVSGSGVVRPILRAVSTMRARPSFGLPLPMTIDSFTAIVFSECASALTSGSEPM